MLEVLRPVLNSPLTALVMGLAAISGAATAAAATATDEPAVAAVTGRVIVKLRADSVMVREHAMAVGQSAQTVDLLAQRRADAFGSRLGLRLRSGRVLSDRIQVLMSGVLDSAALAARLSALPDVEYAIENRRQRIRALPNDPLFAAGPASGRGPVAGQWYLRTPNATLVSAINAEGAWNLVTPNPALVVAVLDTGVLGNHADLAGRVLAGYDMVSETAEGNDGSARDPDASDPGDWVTSAEDSNPRGAFHDCGVGDSSWHGTMVSGIIGAASNNGIGMAGIASGVRILPVRVLGKCGGFTDDIVAGMYWAAGKAVPGVPNNPNPARVLNLSLGGDGACPKIYRDAVNELTAPPYNAVIVVAAGNSAGLAVGNPANCAGVVAVAGLRHAGSKVGFSDLGPEITVAAPGGNCVNTAPGTPCLYPILASSNTGKKGPVTGGSTWTDSYNISVGTSFSTPIVAGISALMLSARPTLGAAELIDLLKRSARPFPTSGAGTNADGTPVLACRAPDGVTEQSQCYCSTAVCGAGMVDAAAAVQSVIQGVPLSVGAEQLLDYAEQQFSGYFPEHVQTQDAPPFRYRHYPTTGATVGVVISSDSQYVLNGVYVTGGPFGPALTPVGLVGQYITPSAAAQSAGRAP